VKALLVKLALAFALGVGAGFAIGALVAINSEP